MLLRLFDVRFVLPEDEPHGFMLSFQLRPDFFKLLVRFKLVLKSIIAFIIGFLRDTENDLVGFWHFVGPGRDHSGVIEVLTLLLLGFVIIFSINLVTFVKKNWLV